MFYYSLWTALSLPTRHAIASKFGITKRGPTHVDSNVVVSDGYDVKEVEAKLTVDAIQSYLETSEKDAAVLWEMLVAKTEGKTPEPLPEVTPVVSGSGDSIVANEDKVKIGEFKVEVDANIYPIPVGSKGDANVPKKKGGRPKKAK